MYKKKLMSTCLAVAMAFTLVTTNVPVIAADITQETETQAATTRNVWVEFKTEDGTILDDVAVVTIGAKDTYFHTSAFAVPEGYEVCNVGDVYAGDADKVTVDVRKIAEPEATTRNVWVEFKTEDGTILDDVAVVTIGAKDTYFHTSAFAVPEGYEVCNVGDVYVGEADKVTVDIRKIVKPEAITRNVWVEFKTEDGTILDDVAVVTIGAKDTYFHTSAFAVPEGYEVCNVGDVYVGDADKVTVDVRKVTKTTSVYVVYNDYFTGEFVGDETITGGRQDENGNYLFLAPVDCTLPEGYEFAVAYDTEEVLKPGTAMRTEILVRKAEVKETVLHITFETPDGEVVDTVTVSTTAVGADGECWTFMLGTDFDLPEGYKLTADERYADQIINIDIPFGATGGHTMIVDKIVEEAIVKVQFVDDNTKEVVAGGDYFVGVDAFGIFNTSELLEWVPEGYELAEFGDFFVSLYENEVLQLSVVKVKAPVTPETPETPENPEKPVEKPVEKPADKPAEKPNKDTPKTGDPANTYGLTLTAGISFVIVLGIVLKKRLEKTEER